MAVKKTYVPATRLTAKLAAVFWRAFGRACRKLGLFRKEDTEEYRKRVLMQPPAISGLPWASSMSPARCRFCLIALSSTSTIDFTHAT